MVRGTALMQWLLLVLSQWKGTEASVSSPRSRTVNVTMNEEQEAGTPLVNLQSVNGLPREGRYQFFPPSDLFDVNASSGVVYTKSRIDRDALCDQDSPLSRSACCRALKAACTLELTVMMEYRGSQQLIPVSVTLRDVNDNAPSFAAELNTVVIKENSRNFEVSLPVATDRDAELFDVQEYRLLPGNYSSLFELRCNADDGLKAKGVSSVCRRAASAQGPLRPQLFVKSPADREKQDVYELVLLALDGGTPPLSASTTIQVLVADDNDHSPRFAHAAYSFNVSESEPVGFEIGLLLATDNDTDKNAEIDYRIESGHSRADEFFSIEHGVLRLVDQLDYDGAQQQFRFLVIANDGGQLSASTSVTVNVLDANDNQPRVAVHLVGQSNTEKLMVVENESNQQRILGLVEAFDADSDREGQNNNVTCSMDSAHFQLVPQPATSQPGWRRYAIYSRRPLDREERDTLELTVVCVDNGNVPLTAQAQVLVEVHDVNDNAPLLSGTSSFQIAENSQVGSLIGVLNASDADQANTDNSSIVYRLSNEADAQIVSIDPVSGQLFAAREFDREERAEYRFQVTLSDRGSPPLSSTCQIVVKVLDVNDNAPQIRNSSLQFSVREDLAPHSAVGRLDADDADEPSSENARVRFRLVSGDEFFILEDNGQLFSRGTLDREKMSSYLVLVNLTNYAQTLPSPSSSATVRIDVLDVKDTPPRFLARAQQTVANVSCYETRSVELARLTAVDDDLDDTLVYTITAGNEDGHFTIDQRTGVVRLASGNWRCVTNAASVIKLHITATDSTGRSAVTVLNVLVTQESGPKASAAEAGPFSSEAVKIVIVLICASLVLATAMIVVVLVFKVRPKRSHESRYLQAAAVDDVFPKRDVHVEQLVEDGNKSEANSSEDRYAAVLDDNNNSGADTAIQGMDARPPPPPDYDSVRANRDSASRCSSLLAADNRSTLTRTADRELLYHTHARLARPMKHCNKPPAMQIVDCGATDSATECECTACKAEYASVSEYPYAATLARPIPPLPLCDDANSTCNSRRGDQRTLPRRLASTSSVPYKLPMKSDTAYQTAAELQLHQRQKRSDGQSMYGDMMYCSACDAVAHGDARLQQACGMPLGETLVQLTPQLERTYGTCQLAQRTKSLLHCKPTMAAASGVKTMRSAFNQPPMDRSLTYVTPNKLALKAKEVTYGDHSKSSPYYSVSYV